MNKLKGKIIGINTVDQFSQVKLEIEKATFISIVIAVAGINPSLKIGNSVFILFKETDVTLSIDQPKWISIANNLPVSITQKQPGIIMTRIKLDFRGHSINAVVPSDFAQQLQVGDEIIMLIRSNEIMLMD